MIPRMLIIARNAYNLNKLILNDIESSRRLHTWNRAKMPLPPTNLSLIRCLSDNLRECWNCNFAHKSELFCSKCKSIQELPDNVTYFDIVGVEQNYDVSPTILHDKYRQLQLLLHPDKFSNKSDREKQISESLSSFVNKAYSTLLHPLSRGLYILKMNNVSITEDTINMDKVFLLEIMEKNEEIEEASQDKDKVIILAKENKQILDDLTREVTKAFQNGNLEQAKQLLIRMKYFTTIDNTLKQIKQNLCILD